MLFHADGSALLSHFIKGEHLVTILTTRAFFLTRLDAQSDTADGKLPEQSFANPHVGELERTLDISPKFLVSQANAIAALRPRTFIMCWTHEPDGHMREKYGEDGLRCELRVSIESLKQIVGYEWPGGFEFPPRPRAVPELPGGRTTVQLKTPVYTDGSSAIPVVPSFYATAHKDQRYSVEAEVRLEAIVEPPNLPIDATVSGIRWELAHMAGLSVTIGAKVPLKLAEEICSLTARVGMPAPVMKSPTT